MRPLATSAAAEVDEAIAPGIDPFALSLNENPFPPLPAVRSVLVKSIDAANRYPEFLPERLRNLIASRIGVGSGQVVLGAGATGVVLQTLQALTVPGDTMVMATPTFDGYPIIAQMARLNSVTVPLDKGGHNDLDRLADAAASARVVVVCRPHNPTGTLEPATHLFRFLRRVRRETIVLLDEAYIEFAAPEHQIDVSALARRFPNVVVVRTFSKAYGLAGLRIGYGVAADELAATMWSHQLPFGVAMTSLPAVAASYNAEDELLQRIRMITSERRYLRMRLSALGVYTTDAHANFMYLPSRDGQDRQWSEMFADSGLRVRCYPGGGARITVGSRASTLAVLAAVGK
ncbi:pyridoxal phosphate-dependent aminotransferase [Mycobacterium montefiorense]|uniref:pyridoxal phosphate-dependent aminotransferase n=1 Tax=Mycobacterium montefiorense TaxID=154654 RepID=UPI0021DE97DA|nr:aminotransferase class I/II-fold pyridoxal phosphate-dependent enzyme [Mycobacterium montefiorense]MCV7426430.1 aminotransferase class I/II-fold pyridoxal phosphate-dependent enzyme [Mycobacterium montefiorense]GLE53798.1 aspartate aminotransferase [Mycobacterium montefiorense]